MPSRHRRRLRPGALASLGAVPTALVTLALVTLPPQLVTLTAAWGQTPTTKLPATTQLRSQQVAPLPGGLDGVLMVNDNNPELISGPGILLSTFAGSDRGVPAAHLDLPLNGRFDLFSHHVYAGTPGSANSTLWLAVLAQPRGNRPGTLRLVDGATALSQSLDPSQPSAPFLPLPALLAQGIEPVYAGPGSRVATELLRRQPRGSLPASWTLAAAAAPTTLLVLPLPVRGLDPLLNGRNLQLRLQSDTPVDLAMLAGFGEGDQPPRAESWAALLEGPLSAKEHLPSPRGASGPIIYSRVSGVQLGSRWRARITDPGQRWLSTSSAPISWPIASLERGRLGTGQSQSAELRRLYPGTAWAAHGNYGVEYEITMPLRNSSPLPQQLQLALESPIKGDLNQGGLRFYNQPTKAVMFRGTVEVSGLDGEGGRASGPQAFHLVLRAGQQGPRLGLISLGPGQGRELRVRLIYPADATPPQVLSLLPVKQSEQSPTTAP